MAGTLSGTAPKLGIVLLLGVLGAYTYFRTEAPSLPSARPRRGDLAELVREEARTRYREIEVVTMPIDGRLLPSAIEEGDRVTAGQELAKIQEDLPAAALEAAESELAAARSQRDRVLDLGVEDAGVARAQAAVQASAAAREAREKELEVQLTQGDLEHREAMRLRGLKSRGVTPADQLDRAETEDRRAAGQVVVARAMVAAARAEESAARARLTEARALRERARLTIPEMEARVKALAARRVPLADDRGRTRIAPARAGRILAVHHRTGGPLPRGTPLFEVGDPSSLEVEVDLLTEDAAPVARATLCSVHGGALGDTEYPVKLRDISPAGFTKRSSLGVEEQRTRAWFTFAGKRPDLGHGYRIHLKAAVKVARGVLLAPRRGLFRTGADWSAFVLSGGTARVQAAAVDIGDESWVVVTRGITEGNTLLLDAPETLKDGAPVHALPCTDLPDPTPLPGEPHRTGP